MNKSFICINYNNEDDLLAIIYTCLLPEEKCTFSEFKKSLNNQSRIDELVKNFEKESSVIAQFQIQVESNKDENITTVNNPGFIRDTIAMLIMDGLSPHYCLNEMKICDLSFYVDAYKKKKQAQMENDRLWTYLLIRPHITKPLTINEFYPFPWEEQEIKQIAAETIKSGADMLDEFMKKGKSMFKN